MSIKILAVGKKHEDWIMAGVKKYESRLRKPLQLQWQLVQHSTKGGEQARKEESERILAKLKTNETVILLDERGTVLNSVSWAEKLASFTGLGAAVTIIIGGSFGVDERVRARAKFVWSLSNLVFPHQLVRLILAEQVYRAQEILAGKSYHHG